MSESLGKRFGMALQHGIDVFRNGENSSTSWYRSSVDIGPGYGDRPDRKRVLFGGERTIISSIYTRIAIDVASTTFEHVRVDENDFYVSTINSGLNQCLNVEANIDQSAFAFKVDMVYSLLDEGAIALVPTETSKTIRDGNVFDIYSMRVGKIVGWHPKYVDLMVYNENTSMVEPLTLPKSAVAILENPFYSVMNEPNSTLKRLVYKLGLLDDADARANSTKLDLIVQLPYTIRGDMQKKRAEERKKDIEFQLTGSKYGIAYLDATEKVTQLNRPVENKLLEQIQQLTDQLYSQLGLDASVLNGTATAETMNNYYQRTVSAIVQAIKEELTRKFLSKTARSQGQRIMNFQDPFKYMTVNQIAQIVDTLSRNEVLTPNEFRVSLGYKPSSEPSANELRNKNLINPNDNFGGTGSEEDPVDSTDQEEPEGGPDTTFGSPPVSNLM